MLNGKIIIHRILALGIVFLFCNKISSTTVLSDSIFRISHYPNAQIDLNQYARVFTDTSNSMLLEDMTHQNFVPLENYDLALGSNFYWVKLSVKSELSHESEWKLHLFDDWCEEVVVYGRSVDNEKSWSIQKAGFQTSLSDLDVNNSTRPKVRKVPNAISLTLKSGKQIDLFIRYRRQMRDYLYINLQLTPIVVHANQLIDYNRKSFYTLLIIGMLLILAFYHILVFLMLKDPAYLFYSLYTGTAAFAGTVMDQYGLMNYHLFYSSHPGIQPWVFNWIGTLAVAFYILFTRSYLNTKSRFSKLDITLLVVLAIGVLSALVGSINFVITGRQYLPGMPFPAYMVLIMIVFILLVYSIWKDRRSSDNFYLFGIGLMLILLTPGYLFDLLNMQDLKNSVTSLGNFGIIQIGLVVELLVFALGLGYRTRQLQLEKQHFEELDQLKSRFFTNISHEFRTPLTLILGPLQRIKTKLNSDEDKNLVSLVQKNANGLLLLVNRLMDLSKLESKNVKLSARLTSITPFLKGIFYSFQSLADQKEIMLEFTSSSSHLQLYIDRHKMESIWTNLVSNAIKFSDSKGVIKLDVTDTDREVNMKLTDTGSGIRAEKLKYIFDRYYQIDDNEERSEKGSGVGLAIVKELVGLHHGRIKVDSQLGKGTTFELAFPIGKKHLKESDLIKSDNSFSEPSTRIESVYDINNGEKAYPSSKDETIEFKSTILIIEDHEDVRAFIKSELAGSYSILEAENGAQGIKMAIDHTPDLILSDVMMPKKNGYEVCDILKKDIRTSHIPIILLTAKGSSDEKIEGLTTGADDYLIKPFDSQELRVRIENLIRLRTELRSRFSSAIHIKPSEVSVNPFDQSFIEQALSIIENHMDNEDFNVTIMSKEIGLSNTQLNRKLRSLVDQSTNQFINSTRLQRAAELLKKNEYSISEIGFMTGFRSSAYFISTFGGHFGVTPGAFREDLNMKKDKAS